MSTSSWDYSSFLLPDKSVALVKKITEKTREGKIVWQKIANGLSAYVPGVLKMSFVEAPFASLFAPRWVVLVVRDEAGNELLKVENKATAVPSLGAPLDSGDIAQLSAFLIAGDPLINAVTELHNLILSQLTKGGVDRAIDLLDNI